MKIAYIIGPYRADTIYGIRQNIIQAEKVGAAVAEEGFFPYIPHKNTAFYDGLAPDELWINGNLELIRRGIADFAVVCKGWEKSSGSKTEINLFCEMRMPILYIEDPSFLIRLRKIKK